MNALTMRTARMGFGTQSALHSTSTSTKPMHQQTSPSDLSLLQQPTDDRYVAVLISTLKRQQLLTRTDSVYTHFDKVCRAQGVCLYFFAVDDLAWEQGLIRGLYLVNGVWTTRIFPMPAAIYDRCFGKNNHEITANFKATLKIRYPRIPVFNSFPKLTKWETFQALRKYDNLLPYLPPSRSLSTASDLYDFVRNYETVYLKPNALYKGKGVFRLKAEGEGFRLEHRGEDENESHLIMNLKEADAWLQNYVTAGGGYLAQMGIDLMKYLGHPFDFRVLCQKDGTGEWSVTAIAGRLAASGSIITSPRSGGAVEHLATMLKQNSDNKAQVQAAMDEVNSVSLEICKAIENSFGLCGELGLDLAIDSSWHLWVLEVNGKPLKVSINRLPDSKGYWKSLEMPMEYVMHLAGYL